jgi:hypothetical protein
MLEFRLSTTANCAGDALRRGRFQTERERQLSRRNSVIEVRVSWLLHASSPIPPAEEERFHSGTHFGERPLTPSGPGGLAGFLTP